MPEPKSYFHVQGRKNPPTIALLISLASTVGSLAILAIIILYRLPTLRLKELGLLLLANAIGCILIDRRDEYRNSNPPDKIIIRHTLLPRKQKFRKPIAFTDLVARREAQIKHRAALIFVALAMCGEWVGLSSWFIGTAAVLAIWQLLDIGVIYYRAWTKQYGTNDVEALEAIRFVVWHASTKGGGGHFDAVFDAATSTKRTTSMPTGVAEGAR